MFDTTVPVLCLLDALSLDGWQPVEATCTHSSIDPTNQFDSRSMPSKRAYYQCVLSGAELFRRGAADFKSGLTTAFYLLLLRDPARAKPGMKAKEAIKLARGIQEWVAPPLLQRAPPQRLAERVGVSGVVESTVDDVVVVPPKSPSSPSSSSSSSSSKPPSPRPQADPAPQPSPPDGAHVDYSESLWPRTIFGMVVSVERRGTEQEGLRLLCNNPAHEGCRCFRTARLDVAALGQRAPVFFLACWLLGSDRDNHHKWRPSLRDVRAVADTYGDITS